MVPRPYYTFIDFFSAPSLSKHETAALRIVGGAGFIRGLAVRHSTAYRALRAVLHVGRIQQMLNMLAAEKKTAHEDAERQSVRRKIADACTRQEHACGAG